MTSLEEQLKASGLRTATLKAIGILLKLFTPEQIEDLAIKNGDVKVTLVEQLVARWWNYIPITSNPIVFRGRAAKILATHKHLIKVIKEADEGKFLDIMKNPDSYKKSTDTGFEFKKTNKSNTMSEASNAGLVRILGKTLGGNSGVSETYSYTQDWEMDDRKKLDAIKLNISKVARDSHSGKETGEADHDIEEEWLKKHEPLETLEIVKNDLSRTKKDITFSEVREESRIGDLNIHEVSLTQSTNVTASETGSNSFSLFDSVNRGKGTKERSEFMMAEAAFRIQGLELVDIREQLYRRFDPLFTYHKSSKPCQ